MATLDGHIHLVPGAAAPEDLSASLSAAGVDGGVLISRPPASFGTQTDAPVSYTHLTLPTN